MCSIQESDIHVVLTRFPSGVRDFCLVRSAEGGLVVPVQSLELLQLDRTGQLIELLALRGRNEASLAMNLALCRLLVPQLRYRGSGRHLVVEPWTEADLQGATLRGPEHDLLARDLSQAQADDWRLVTSGERPAEGTLPDLVWSSFTMLPQLADRFDDPELGAFTKALYFLLVPEGTGMAEVSRDEIRCRIAQCRESGFQELGLPLPTRRMNQLFRKALAVTLRWSAQLTGIVAEQLIQVRAQASGDSEATRSLTQVERDLLELRYGGSRALSDINVGYLFGCGELLADLVNDYATAHVMDDSLARDEAAENLGDCLLLLSRFLERRRSARAHQRRELRQRRADRMPRGARRIQAETERDDRAHRPDQPAQPPEDVEMFRRLLPHLKERDAKRLQAFIDANGDRRAAAESLGLSLTEFSRQLRQTVVPNARRAARQLPQSTTEEE